MRDRRRAFYHNPGVQMGNAEGGSPSQTGGVVRAVDADLQREIYERTDLLGDVQENRDLSGASPRKALLSGQSKSDTERGELT